MIILMIMLFILTLVKFIFILQYISQAIAIIIIMISQLGASDLVVSPRFHNLIVALLLNKPVIAIAYHEKFLEMMRDLGLSKYTVQIEQLDGDALIRKLIDLETNSQEVKMQIMRKVEAYRYALREQYSRIFHDS